jgi:Holliday junction resolvasome RuvABC endonuclease subunit
MSFIVGIDPSLSSSGVCVFNTDTMETHVAQIDGHHNDCHLGERCRRIAAAVNHQISSSQLLDACDRVEVFIENPAGALRGFAQDLPVLYWAIIMELEGEKFLYPTIYPVASATLKKFVCGRGNAKPEDKVVAVLNKYSHMLPEQYVVSPETKGGMMAFKDLYDAVGLAALGHCYLGGDGYTKAQVESLAKIKPL